MAEVHIVDIQGEQWNIKDAPLTVRVAALEEKQFVSKGGNYTGVVTSSWAQFLNAGKLPAGKYMFIGNCSVAMSLAIQRAGANLLVTSTTVGANIFYFQIPNSEQTADVTFACQSNYQSSFTLGWSVIKVDNN